MGVLYVEFHELFLQSLPSYTYPYQKSMQSVYFVPVYNTRPRDSINNILFDDITPIVGLVSPQYISQYQPSSSSWSSSVMQDNPQYQPSSSSWSTPLMQDNPQFQPASSSWSSPFMQDDMTFRMRPNTDSIMNRSYDRYGPLQWSWKDFSNYSRSGKIL